MHTLDYTAAIDGLNHSALRVNLHTSFIYASVTNTTRTTARSLKRKILKKDLPRGTLLESMIMIPTGALLYDCVMICDVNAFLPDTSAHVSL